MKEAEKFLKDNNLSDELLNWDDDERDVIYISEIMQKYTDQQLIIHGFIKSFYCDYDSYLNLEKCSKQCNKCIEFEKGNKQ